MAARVGLAFHWACMALVVVLIATAIHEGWIGMNGPHRGTLRALAGPLRCVVAAIVVAAAGHSVRRLLSVW